MSDALTNVERKALADAFSNPDAAGFLLEDAGLPRSRQPGWSDTAELFWYAVSRQLAAGAVPDGRKRLLAAAAERYPANEVFAAAAGAGSGSGPLFRGRPGVRAGWEPQHGHPVMVTVIAVDAVGFSRQRTPVQLEWRTGIYAVTEKALAAAGVPIDLVRFEDRGDGYLALVAVEVPLPKIVADFARELRIALDAYNSVRNETGRVRLRVAVHRGDVVFDRVSFTSDAPVVAVRLVDAPPVRDALKSAPDTDIALIISDEVFRATVAEGYRGLNTADFLKVSVLTPKFSGVAWVRIVEHRRPGAPSSSRPRASTPTEQPTAMPKSAPDDQPAPESDDVDVDVDYVGELDFLVSCAKDDEAWGEWIAWLLEAEGHRVHLQSRVLAGNQPVNILQEGIRRAKRTLAVLSENYLRSPEVQAQWQSAWDGDPQGVGRKLIPVRVEECRPEGLLRGISYIDLVGLASEEAAHELVEEVKASLSGRRARPGRPPSFPGRP